jgi:UDP-N-acetyl-D-glucosamine dehydrogenase
MARPELAGEASGAGNEGVRMMGDNLAPLLTAIDSRNARVAVIGLGYVGLPLAVVFAEAGYRVTGIDVDRGKVAAIQDGRSYIDEVPAERLAPLVAAGRLDASADFGRLVECQAVSICVPTPLRKTGDPDISYIVSAADAIARYLQPGMLVVLESTTYPGTTTEVILPKLSDNDAALQVGEGFFLCFSPERVDPGRVDWTTVNTPKVIGGVTASCLQAGQALYASAIERVVPVSSTEAAEMVKLLENTFRAVNIGLVNEVLLMCDRLGLDVWEVIEAAATKPFGFMRFTPGPGLGGHCIPIDPLYLSWKLKTLDYKARFIELASEINTGMPHYWTEQVQDALNAAHKPVNGSSVLVLGVAYKRDVGDTRESPALDIMHLLEEKGARVRYHDPHVPSLDFDGKARESEPVLTTALAAADCVVIAADHSTYDWSLVRERARLLVDTRGVLRSAPERRHAGASASAPSLPT